MPNQLPVSPAEIERETGFGKDQLRKWRERFGFPSLQTMADGKTGFSRDTVNQLRMIKRLLDDGFRPGQVVGKTPLELETLCSALGLSAPTVPWSDATQRMVEQLKRADLAGLSATLAQERAGQTLLKFVLQTLAPLLTAVGEAWARNELDIHHEHLCTSLIERYLHASALGASPKQDYPIILFALPPGEKHLLGLLMIEAVLADQGAKAIFMGGNIPLNNLKLAAISCKADVVALSFSFAYPARAAAPMLLHLRRLLPDTMEIWAGGAGLASIRRQPKGVRILAHIEDAVAALQSLAAGEARAAARPV
jgi:methylmalonyl-CoA mutase cobalamin-binding subunit